MQSSVENQIMTLQDSMPLGAQSTTRKGKRNIVAVVPLCKGLPSFVLVKCKQVHVKKIADRQYDYSKFYYKFDGIPRSMTLQQACEVQFSLTKYLEREAKLNLERMKAV